MTSPLSLYMPVLANTKPLAIIEALASSQPAIDAALKSIDRKGQCVRIADVMDETRARMSGQVRAA